MAVPATSSQVLLEYDLEELQDENDEDLLEFPTDTDTSIRAPTSHRGDIGEQDVKYLPDLSVICDRCQRFVAMHEWRRHAGYHQALSTMRLDVEPANMETLVQQRHLLVHEVIDESRGEVVSQFAVHAYDEAFETIKSNLRDNFTPEYLNRMESDLKSSTRSTSHDCTATNCVLAVGVASNPNKVWRSDMEAFTSFEDKFGGDPKQCFFGLYSGYNGPSTAEVAAKELHKFVLLEMSNCNIAPNILHHQISPTTSVNAKETFRKMPSNVISQNNFKNLKNGPTLSDIVDGTMGKIESEILVAGVDRVNLVEDKISRRNYASAMSKAFTRSHKIIDNIVSFGVSEKSRVRWSGCSTAVCVIQEAVCGASSKNQNENDQCNTTLDRTPSADNVDSHHCKEDEMQEDNRRKIGTIHLSNAGDVRVVLVRKNRAYRMSEEHTPRNTKEHDRVLSQGGSFSGSQKQMLVNGVLSTTRGLGNHGDGALKQCVITKPYTTSIELDASSQLVIIASSGVWQVLSEREAALLLLQMIPSFQIPPDSRLSMTIENLFSYDRTSTLSIDVRTTSVINNIEEQSVEGVGAPTRGSDCRNQDQDDISNCDRTSLDDHCSNDFGQECDVSRPASVVSLKENVGVPKGRFSSKPREDPESPGRRLSRLMAERLIEAALIAGSRDNITAMVVLLTPCISWN